MSGTLYVVATPIGNLEDITARALRILREVDLIAAEDTRHSRKLLTHFGIGTPMVAYHEHNEASKADELVSILSSGKSLALISDAGTPAIADPGYRLVQQCRQAEITVVPIPGASAILAALSASGLPTDRFAFEGFLPAKAGARRSCLTGLTCEQRTLVFYESPHRLIKSLTDMAEIWPGRDIAVGRELTKLHEEWICGTTEEVVNRFSNEKVRGEIVLVVGPASAVPVTETVEEALQRWRETTDLSWKEIVKQVAREQGVTGSIVYQKHLQIRQSNDK